jgi:hypothetical protein
MAPNPIKRKSEKLSRRKFSIFKKSYELAILCDLDIAVFIRTKGKKSRYYNFKSSDDFHPTVEQIVGRYPFSYSSILKCHRRIHGRLLWILPHEISKPS